jgi:predicted RNA-binding Zn ribbon-like protein
VSIVGGNLALDFVNTGGHGHGTEALRGYPDVVAWAEHAGALTEADAARLLRRARRDPVRAAAEFERTIMLRDSLSRLFGAVAANQMPDQASLGGASPDDASLAFLRRSEADALEHARLTWTGSRYAWSWDGDEELARPTRLVTHASTSLLTQGSLDRVRRCAGCPYLFLDTSRNRSRRWCSMQECGTQEKMRRFVKRRAQARTGSPARE